MRRDIASDAALGRSQAVLLQPSAAVLGLCSPLTSCDENGRQMPTRLPPSSDGPRARCLVRNGGRGRCIRDLTFRGMQGAAAEEEQDVEKDADIFMKCKSKRRRAASPASRYTDCRDHWRSDVAIRESQCALARLETEEIVLMTVNACLSVRAPERASPPHSLLQGKIVYFFRGRPRDRLSDQPARGRPFSLRS